MSRCQCSSGPNASRGCSIPSIRRVTRGTSRTGSVAFMSRASREDIPELAWSIPSLREPRYSQSLERGLAVLSCFTAEHPVLGIADIADGLGMSRSTTHRYASTLVVLGYLDADLNRSARALPSLP